MEITYFIGNGFDLNLGLKTSYVDFRKHLLNRIVSDDISEEPIKFLRDDLMENKYEIWSDAEIAFGKLPEKYGAVKDKFASDFFYAKAFFQNELASYLSNERKKFLKRVTPKSAPKVDLGNAIRMILPELHPDVQTIIKEKAQTFLPFQRQNVICFNYTDCCEWIFQNAVLIPSERGQFLYIHGKWNENMVFGRLSKK